VREGVSAVRIEFYYDPTVACSDFWDGGVGGGGGEGRHGRVERFSMLGIMLIIIVSLNGS